MAGQVGGIGRFYPNPGKPVLIYLPGVHGDWTLFSSFRALGVREFQIVEFTYPRTLTWSLAEYAQFVLRELERHHIESGWVLAESYSSQVAWAMLEQGNDLGFRVEGIILAGGFARYPIRSLARAAALALKVLPGRFWRFLFWAYARYARFRHRHAPESREAVEEFVRRRTPLDIAAMRHRIELIVGNDPRAIVSGAHCPVYLLAGWIDPVVVTWPVLAWLRRNCPQFRGSRLIWPADHNVLGTEPAKALAQITVWIAGN
jgi:hypothetical protein